MRIIQDEELQKTLNEVATKVELKLREVSDRTLSKLREMDESVADSLKPVIPSSNSLKWADVFKNVSITGDDDIPINKRGSGVKRLILLNFFRAEVERRNEEGDSTGIIYAIEEPETSQHFANQKIIADAIKELSETNNSQVIITTHSGVIVKRLDCSTLRLVSGNNDGEKTVTYAPSGLLGYTSINEINYTAFGEVTEEYHDELWGVIKSHNWMGEYESDKQQIPYVRVFDNGNIKNKTHTLSHYIRDVMHHPENKNNRKYTDVELEESICLMRDFIKMKLNNQDV